jgi:DNA-binding NtrC family response regulator
VHPRAGAPFPEAAIVHSSASGASPFAGQPAVVVALDRAHRAFLESTLSAAGLTVTVADNFHSARAALTAQNPAVLVTEIRLEKYNGLHLAIFGKSIRPDMAVVVTSGLQDRVLRHDAENLGVIFLTSPVSEVELLAALNRAAMREPQGHGVAESSRPGRLQSH